MRGSHKIITRDDYPVPFGFRWMAPVYRFVAGRPMNGHRYTDATAFRYGTMAVDLSGRASSYHLLPGYKRFLYFRLPILATPGLAILAISRPGHMLFLAIGLATLAMWDVSKRLTTRRFRRSVVEPLAATVSEVLRQRHVAGAGHTWVSVPDSFRDSPDAEVVIRLPMSWTGEEGDKARLARVVASRLQVDEVATSWQLHSNTPTATFRVPGRPPGQVSFQDGIDLAERVPATSLACGLGPRGKPEEFSLTLESPHLIVAGGPGAGKSEFLAFLVGQFMRRGYGVSVLDAKYVSHMWLRRIPGVLYASEDQELHEALVWLGAELRRRARFVAAGGDWSSLTPLIVLMEEINGASNRLRSYWRTIKTSEDPAMSPALTELANLANLGREMMVHIVLAGQSVTAKSVGGPEGREAYGGRVLARATTAQWKMLAPQIKPAPVKRNAPGRWHLVVGDTVREYQAPFMAIKDEPGRLIEWATGGAPVPDVPAMMAAAEGVATTRDARNASSEPVTPDGISLRQYADEAGLNLATVRKWADRQDFPVEVGVGANRTRLYDRDHLRDYVRARLREPVTVDES